MLLRVLLIFPVIEYNTMLEQLTWIYHQAKAKSLSIKNVQKLIFLSNLMKIWLTHYEVKNCWYFISHMLSLCVSTNLYELY
jgi:hypothetical protein